MKKLFYKKCILSIVSLSLIHSQLLSAVFMASVLTPKTASAYDEIIPPKNIKDNPIKHIEVDPNSGKTHLDRAQNGTPVININAASKGGVSVNYYRDFNINEENVIFNNYKGEAANSVLGGSLHGNPNFNPKGAKAADIILNEVTSGRITNINGYAEVFGKKADLIIANPNGIMVSGAGFINTNRVSLITGKSSDQGTLDANGNLNPFMISENPNAVITVVGRNITDAEGKTIVYNLGIDATNSNYVDLISRVVKINGDIYASEGVNIKTGNDKATYNKTTKEFDVSSTDKGDKPEFAIDSTVMGGIYAGRISLIATEQGVGVRTRSDLVASVEDIKFDVKGNIVLGDTGSVHARRNVTMSAAGKVTNDTIVVAEESVQITADDVQNNDQIYAADSLTILSNSLQNDGAMLTGTGDTTLKSGTIVNAGEISSGGALTIVADDLNNDQGALLSHGKMDISFNNPTDYTLTGVIYTNDDFVITAENITNMADMLAANNIIFNAAQDIFNGDGTTSAALVAFNNAILNAGGSLYNYGSIVANNTIVITAGDSVYNGLAIGSDARINAGANLVVTAGNSIVNKGYLQSLGNVYLKSNAAINDDYQLGDTVIDLGDLDTTKTPVLTPEAEALLNDLANITDLDVLYALMSEVISEEQFNAVQDRILIVKIKSTLDDFVDDRTFDMSDYLDLDEDEILELMQNLLTDEYDEADWKIDLSTKEAAIDQLIAAQFGRYNDYVAAKESAAQTQYNTDKEAARQQYIIDNGNDSGFTWPAFSFTAPSLSDYVAATPGEDVLDKPQYMQDAAQAAQEERFDRIKDITDAQVSKAGSYDTINWLSLTDEELNEKLEDLLGEEYDVMDWMRLTYIPRDVAQEITQEYLGSLRIDADKIKNVEKTGIHNYGRIYSGNDMLLESNSVVHNNKGSLIYSEGDMTFLVNKVLFNNENAIGQGILSKGNLNIMGNGTDENGNPTSLEKLLNYDGRIEADLNITIKAKDTVNYGSDSIDLSKIDNTIQPLNQYWYTVQECKRTFRGGKRCSMVNYYITEEEYNTRKDNGDTNLGMQWTGYYYVKDYPELDDAHDLVYVKDADPWLYKTVQSGHDKVVSYVTSNASSIQSNQGTVSITGDNVVNYNSTIFGDNVVIQTQNLLNTALQYNVNAKIYYTYKGKKCKWHGGSCKTYTNTWTTPTVLTVEGDKSAGIVARNALVISAQTIGNGTASVGDFSTNMPLPYDSGITYEDIVDHISKTGTINPADHIALPSGDYGIFRKPSDPDSKFLYETDPTLVDLSQFLGSEYFMNRISEDPFTHDLKFLGDSYFEHEMIKKSLEQIPLFQHSSFSDAEITRFINSLYSAVSEDLVSQLNLEFGKELTAEQINALEHDIVWYVKQTITLPDGSETEALVPMVYFSQGTINAMAAESNKIGDMQKELSAKQASDIATVQGTQAGNKAVQTELDRVSGEATKEAAAHLKSPEVMQDISDKTMAYMQENAHIVDQNVTSGYARYLDDKEANKDNANWKDPYVGMSEDAIKESMKQSVEGAMQKAFTDNYTEEIRSAKYNELYAQKLDTVDQEGIYKTAYDTAYEGAYQGAYDKALAQNQSNQNSSSVLRGNDIYIASLDPTATSVLNNAGMIAGGRQVAISVDQINNITSTLGGNQASIFSGDVLYLNTKNDALGTDGTINNASGFMGTLNQGSLVYLETGELNNLTQSQTAVVDGKGKQFEYHKVDTTLGSTAMIASSGDMIVDTTGDLNMVGAALTATNSALIDVGGNLTSATAVDYDYEYQKTKRSGGMLGESLKKIDITESNTNYASTISAGEHLSIDVGDKLIGVGTHISAGGDLNISADSIALFNAMDTDYEYAFEHRERFDLASAAANVGAAVAAAAVTGGAGAAVVAGAAAASGAMGMKKGSTDISERYDETTQYSSLSGTNINLNSRGDTTFISTNINAANDLNMQIGGDLFIGTAAEQHFSYEHHEKFGGDIAKAAVGGMITGLASGLAFAGGGAIGATLGQGGAFVGLSQAAVTGITTYGGMAASYGSAAMTGLSTAGSTQMMSHNQRLNSLEQSTVLQAASNINVGNNLSIVTNDDLTISASNVTTENDAILKSIAGNVNIVSATENTTTTKRDITTSGFKDLAFSHTNSSASVGGSYTVTDRTTTVNTNTEKGSQLNIGGNLGIMAENDINIIASDILANKDIYMKAQTGDINILSAEQLQTIYDKMGIDTITAGLSVSNKWLGAADSMYKTTQSVLNVDSAPDVVNTFFQLDQGYNSYKKTTESIKKMTDAIDKGQSFGDLATWENAGFSLSGNLTMSHTEVETNITNTTHKGSSIISKTGDIDLDAEGNIRVEGSSIKTLSGENDKGNITLTANTGDIYIGATENTSERSTTSSTSGSTVNVNVNYIGKSEEQDKEKLDKSAKNNNQNTRDPNKEYVNLSGGITSFYKGSSTQSSSTSHNNSVISSANKTNLDTSSGGGNIILEGVNMNSENSTTLNAGSGNVTIASTQDTSSSDSNSYNASYGNALVAGIGASNSDVVKNNYSTVTSENGNVKIIANDLTLTGIKDDIRDNLNTDSVTGNITENQLMEKNKSDSYDIKIAVPLSKKPLWSYDIEVGGEESPKSEDIKNNVSEETKYSAFNLSELAARLKETSLSYKDSNGYDFKGSYNSIENSLEASHKIWTAPNTIIGLGNLGLNAAYGLAIGDPIKIDHKDGIWQVTNAKLNAKNGIAVTLGHVITYYDTYAPGNTVHSYDGTFLVDLEKHEKRHVTQSDILGPLFLPAYFSLGGISKHNLLEKDADNASRIEYNVYR